MKGMRKWWFFMIMLVISSALVFFNHVSGELWPAILWPIIAGLGGGNAAEHLSEALKNKGMNNGMD